MPDLKAAAERLRKSAARQKAEMEIWNSPNAASTDYRARLQQAASDQILAAQALEALAWQAEKEAKVIPWGHEWRCSDGEKIRAHADTPLGALLAAMEGEKDGN